MFGVIIEGVLVYFFAVCVLWVLAAYEWLRHWTQSPPAPVAMTLFAVVVTLYAAFKVPRHLAIVKRYKLGWDGEKAVGEFLDRLRGKGYRVYHDVSGADWNIDHVIISTRGPYTVETKTCSQPDIGTPLIVFGGQSISVDGGPRDERPVSQSLAQSKQLRTLLMEATGQDFPVQPAIVYPGWYIQQTQDNSGEGPWVLNPKALHKWIETQEEVVSADRLKLVGSNLTMIEAIRNAAEFVGVDWQESVRMATQYPSAAIQRSGSIGCVEVGKSADFVEVNSRFEVCRVWRRGRLLRMPSKERN